MSTVTVVGYGVILSGQPDVIDFQEQVADIRTGVFTRNDRYGTTAYYAMIRHTVKTIGDQTQASDFEIKIEPASQEDMEIWNKNLAKVAEENQLTCEAPGWMVLTYYG